MTIFGYTCQGGETRREMVTWIKDFVSATVRGVGWGLLVLVSFAAALIVINTAYRARLAPSLRTAVRVPAPARGKKPTYWETTIIIRAYCPCVKCCGRSSRGLTATQHRIQPQDWSFAVSPDLEAWIRVSNRTKLFVPLYNKPGTLSMANDRTKKTRWRQIEVLMTVAKKIKGRWHSAHRRALLWGHKYGTLRVWSDGRREIHDVRTRR